MKKLFLIAISCLQLALTIEALAAPPLRVLMPMRLADGSVVMPASVNMAPLSLEGCCAAPAMIGEGSYLQHTGSPRILTILAAFQDVGFTVNDPVKAFEQYLNGDKQEDLGNQNQLNMSSVRQQPSEVFAPVRYRRSTDPSSGYVILWGKRGKWF